MVTRFTVTASESNPVDVLNLSEFDHLLKLDWKSNTVVCIRKRKKQEWFEQWYG